MLRTETNLPRGLRKYLNRIFYLSACHLLVHTYNDRKIKTNKTGLLSTQSKFNISCGSLSAVFYRDTNHLNHSRFHILFPVHRLFFFYDRYHLRDRVHGICVFRYICRCPGHYVSGTSLNQYSFSRLSWNQWKWGYGSKTLLKMFNAVTYFKVLP